MRVSFGRSQWLLTPLTRGDLPEELMVGDPVKIVDAMISVTGLETPPRRLLLGSDAYSWVHAALTERLREVEAQRESASFTDIR